MKRWGILIAAVLVLAGCSSSGAGSPATQVATKDPLVTGDYSQVTCAQWLTWDDDDQAAAALEFARRLDAYDSSVSFARSFAENITTDCTPAPQLKLQEVVAALATLDTDDFG